MNPGQSPGSASQLSQGQRALLARKVHIQPGALAHSSGDVQERLPSSWHAAIDLVSRLHGLPDAAFHWWAEQPAGHVLITTGERAYITGSLDAAQQQLAAVTLIPLAQIVRQPQQAAIAALFPLDHLLGCGGAPHGQWLSQGGGLSRRWQRVGAQLARLFSLGYGLSQAARQDPRIYLAEGMITALHDRRRLNIADPKLERLLGASLLSEGFWHNFRQAVS